ncbi:MAG: hypothetical protein SAK29_12690 [Scytonema sp. PMC 1069.18]|nr:hypothetical protein [Scytonema sp. PMC 1069.18]MEC4887903.1 hypothetical protein [Scytonema sp. PMC 1070.18]
MSDQDGEAQIDVLHVAPNYQQFLLEQVAQHSNSAIASQANNNLIVWFQSLDGIRVICFNYSHGSNHNENVVSSFDQVFATKNWIEQVNSHCYQLEFVVTT